MKRRHPAEMCAEVAAALMKESRSASALSSVVCGDTRRGDRITRCCEQFRLSGTVYIAAWTPRGKPVYGWQPTLFERPDVPQPVVEAVPLRGPPARHHITVDGRRMTLAAAAPLLQTTRQALYARLMRGTV